MSKEQSVFNYSLPEVILVSAIIIGLSVAGFVAANEKRGDQEKTVVMNSPTPNLMSANSMSANSQSDSNNTDTSESNSNLENSNSAYWANSNVPPGVPLNGNTSNSAGNVYVTPSTISPFNPSDTVESPSLSVSSIDGKWNFAWSAGDAVLEIKNGSGTFRSPQQYVVVQSLNATSTAGGTILKSSGAFIENSSIRAPNYDADSFLIESSGGRELTIFIQGNVNSTNWDKVQISSVKLAKDEKTAEVKLSFRDIDYVLNLVLNPETDSIISGIIKFNRTYQVVQDVTARMASGEILVTGANPILVKANAKAPTFAPDMFMFKKTDSGFSVMTKDDVYVKEWQSVSVK